MNGPKVTLKLSCHECNYADTFPKLTPGATSGIHYSAYCKKTNTVIVENTSYAPEWPTPKDCPYRADAIKEAIE